MALSPAERTLLQRVADRDQVFENQNVHDPSEGQRLDGELRELQKLERRGLAAEILEWTPRDAGARTPRRGRRRHFGTCLRRVAPRLTSQAQTDQQMGSLHPASCAGHRRAIRQQLSRQSGQRAHPEPERNPDDSYHRNRTQESHEGEGEGQAPPLRRLTRHILYRDGPAPIFSNAAPRRRCKGSPRAGFRTATPRLLVGNSVQLELPGLLPRPPRGLPVRRPLFFGGLNSRVVYQFQPNVENGG